MSLWSSLQLLVQPLAQELCEQLRLVLEPTKAAKLKGDYRTGKRLNMRKIIPYIASQFRKDKIWLRRTKPSKRQYQVLVAVDDSSSMAHNQSRQLAFESLATIGQALTLLEAGDFGILRFGVKPELVHPFSEPYSVETGAKTCQMFTFEQKETNYADMVECAVRYMCNEQMHGASSGRETAQLVVILSDGRNVFSRGEKSVRTAIRDAALNHIFLVFVICETGHSKDSIQEIVYPVFEGDKITMNRYMEKFPFPFYLILHDISSLPVTLGEALRQWFQIVTSLDR